jgi:hypothetical protein
MSLSAPSKSNSWSTFSVDHSGGSVPVTCVLDTRRVWSRVMTLHSTGSVPVSGLSVKSTRLSHRSWLHTATGAECGALGRDIKCGSIGECRRTCSSQGACPLTSCLQLAAFPGLSRWKIQAAEGLPAPRPPGTPQAGGSWCCEGGSVSAGQRRALQR